MLVYFVLGDAKVWRWGSKPTPGPNANGFVSQWNIGFKRIFKILFQVTSHTIKLVFFQSQCNAVIEDRLGSICEFLQLFKTKLIQ